MVAALVVPVGGYAVVPASTLAGRISSMLVGNPDHSPVLTVLPLVTNETPVLAAVGVRTVGTDPQTPVYDNRTGNVYVVNQGSANLTVIHDLSRVGSIAVGKNPSCAVVDPANGLVYVCTNGTGGALGPGRVSVINGASIVANLTTGGCPEGLVSDPANAFVYVPDECSFNATSKIGNVTVINGTSVIATVRLPESPCPDSAAYDPTNGYIYVAGCVGNLSVINGTKVVGTVNGSGGTAAPVFDPANGLLYLSGTGGGSLVSVIQGMQIVANVSVGPGESPSTYDSGNGFVYVPTQQGYHVNQTFANLTVINGTQRAAVINVGVYSSSRPTAYAPYASGTGYVYMTTYDGNNTTLVAIGGKAVAGELNISGWPSGVAYDPANSYLYVTEWEPNGTGTVTAVACASCAGVTVSESGVPTGTAWGLRASNATTWYSETIGAQAPAPITLRLVNGTYTLAVLAPSGVSIQITSANARYSAEAGTILVGLHPAGGGAGAPSSLPWAPLGAGVAGAAVVVLGGVLLARRRLRRQGEALLEGIRRSVDAAPKESPRGRGP